jgi:N-acetylneuraminate synthase/N,N'-diacetyllegionaminate synthase
MNKLREIGKSVFIVAEIGINHNGDMLLARDMIMAAAEAGADSVKFQNYKTEDFVTDQSLIFEYQSRGNVVKESQYNLFKRCELTRDQLSYLKEQCDLAGILFHSTPTSFEGIRDLQAIGCQLLKNGSDNLTNLRLVRAMGETGLKTILSLGMATLSEIDHAVRSFRETGNENLVLLHCTSSYPTPVGDINLARIKTLQKLFGVEVGFSDHSIGATAAIGATILGSRWIEKHFTLSKNLPGPDHWFSMDPKELQELVVSIREAEKMLGTPTIGPTPSESFGLRDFRLSCVAARDIEKGELIKSSDISFQRPGDGISPIHEAFLVGLRLARQIKKGQKFEKGHFSGQAIPSH